MKTYYNEFDKKKAHALKRLIVEGHITRGDIDDRPIQEVTADDVKGYTRSHFFAGIGLWELALQYAGWPADRPVWTGSCPCQPFSTAGEQKGKQDERHLWPEWLRLIRESRPATIFGEQVASSIAKGWLDDVYQGLESEGYAIGSAVLPACSVGAPHKRDRLWFVANSESQFSNGRLSRDSHEEPREEGGQRKVGAEDNSPCNVANSRCEPEGNKVDGLSAEWQHSSEAKQWTTEGNRLTDSSCCDVADTKCERPQGYREYESEHGTQGRQVQAGHHWESGVWIQCPDGKQRLVEPSIPLLANGYTARVPVLHSIGDGIVPQVAGEFIMASMGWRQ